MYVCMHVCMYVCKKCMYACMYGCMYVCLYEMHACMDMFVCMYVCMYVCMHVCMYPCTSPSLPRHGFSSVFANRTSKNTEFFQIFGKRMQEAQASKKAGRGNRAWDPCFATAAPRRLRLVERHQIAARYVGDAPPLCSVFQTTTFGSRDKRVNPPGTIHPPKNVIRWRRLHGSLYKFGFNVYGKTLNLSMTAKQPPSYDGKVSWFRCEEPIGQLGDRHNGGSTKERTSPEEPTCRRCIYVQGSPAK